MFDRTQWFLAGMSIALSVQLSQPVAAAVSVGKVVQIAQIDSNEAAEKALKRRTATVPARNSRIEKKCDRQV